MLRNDKTRMILKESLLEIFVRESQKVGNKNYFLTRSDLRGMPEKNKALFQYVPSLNNFSTYEISEREIPSAMVEVDYGIAETGTCVIQCADEQIRLATSLAETLSLVLPASRIVPCSYDLIDQMEEWTEKNNYIAFITGASRTADIERELAIGVHGPAELIIYIITDL